MRQTGMRLLWASLGILLVWTAWQAKTGRFLAVFLSPGSLEMELGGGVAPTAESLAMQNDANAGVNTSASLAKV